jgi:serine/threonine-protein kinase
MHESTEDFQLEKTSDFVPSGDHSVRETRPSPPSQVNRFIGIQQGTGPQLAEIIARILQKRLRAFVLFFTVVMGLGLCSSFILPFPDLFVFHTPFPLLRLAVLGGLVTAYFFLRKKSKLPLGALRWLEIAVLIAIGLTLLLASSQRILRFAEIGDVASTSFGRAMILTIWSVLILLYGMFIPNSWRRAAMVLLPFAAIPYLNVLYLRWVSPEAAAIFDLNRFVVPIPLPFLAFSAAVYISHLIQSIRREAFAARQLGQYRLQKKLGAGGMGEVYTAEHVLLKRPCAVKLIQLSPDSDANILTRFEREVRANAKLSHWNTVDIFDYGYTADGIFYYSMELLPGLCLQRLVDRYGPMAPERAIYLLRQICRALTEAHEDFGIVHRDIKPANIFASKRGGLYDVAKILDFGLVTQQGVEAPDQDDLSKPRSVSGSPMYMSPEQITAETPIGPWSDIYSLGATAYFTLTGKPPFTGENVAALLKTRTRADAAPPSTIRPEIPKDLEAVILKCMARDPRERYQNVRELREALSQCRDAGKWNPEKAKMWWLQHAKEAIQDLS